MEDLEWIDLVNGESDVDADDINKLAKYIKELNENKPDKNDVAIDVDDKLSTDSLNPVQNKVVTKALGEKVDKVDGKDLSTNDFTDADKEKLDNLPTKTENDEVYASKTDLNKTNELFANALKGNVSGEIVSVKDISPIEYNLKVKLSSDEITDFSTVTLRTIGKNLIPPISNERGNDHGVEWVRNSDNSITLNGTSTNSTISIVPRDSGILFKKGTYTISGNPEPTGNIRLWARAAGSGSLYTGTYNNTPTKITLLEDTYMYFYISVSSGTVVDNLTIYPQFEIGNGTEYEPYIDPVTYTPNADGTVNNVKSIYPSTTLMTDTSGVLIECEYNKDTNKVIENLTNAIISLGGNI